MIVERLTSRSLASAAGLPERAHAAVIAGALPARVAARVARRIQAGDLAGPGERRDRDDAGPQVLVHGVAISPSDRFPTGPDPDAYFASAASFRARLEALFAPDPGPFERLRRVLTALGASSVRLAARKTGAPYGSATVRICPPGVGMGIHCENSYLDIPVNEELRAEVDLARQWSWFFVLHAPARGGAVDLTALSFAQHGAVSPQQFPEAAGALDRALIPSHPGDLVLLASGDLHHRVLPPEGAPRITLGGFFAPARDGRALVYWG